MSPGNPFKRFWQLLRQLTGDDAYERYLAHHMSFHGGSVHGDGACGSGAHPQGLRSEEAPITEAPLTRQQFFQRQQEEKWSRVSRCC